MKTLLTILAVMAFLTSATAQLQPKNGNFSTWIPETCGEQYYESPLNFEPFIGPCSYFTFGETTTYSLDLHVEKVDGATASSPAANFKNTQPASTVNTAMFFNNDESGYLGNLSKMPTSVDITYASSIAGTDSAQVSIYLFYGTNNIFSFMGKMEEKTTHKAILTLTPSTNTSSFTKASLNFTATDVNETPTAYAIMITTHANKADEHEANVETNFSIDDIMFNYESTTAICNFEALISVKSNNSHISIDNGTSEPVNATIHTASGRIAGKQNIPANSNAHINDLPAGIYFVTFKGTENSFIQKVVVK